LDGAGTLVGAATGTFAGAASAVRVSAARVSAARGALVPVFALIGTAVGVLLVVEHAASKPSANRTTVNRISVFILSPWLD